MEHPRPTVRDDLIDPLFDIGPYEGQPLRIPYGTWKDRKTGISFGLERLRADHGGDATGESCLFSAYSKGAKSALVRAKILRVGLARSEDGAFVATYRVSSAEILKLLKDPAAPSDAVSEALRMAIAGLGGEAEFIDYCLRAIRACHAFLVIGHEDLSASLRGGPTITEAMKFEIFEKIGRHADRVEFELVERPGES